MCVVFSLKMERTCDDVAIYILRTVRSSKYEITCWLCVVAKIMGKLLATIVSSIQVDVLTLFHLAA